MDGGDGPDVLKQGRKTQNISDLVDSKILETSSPVDGCSENSSEAREEKKSSFQITRVVSRNGGHDDSESFDDRTGQDDISSDLTDVSQSTNVATHVDSEDTMYSSMEDIPTGIPPSQDESKEKDIQSRFRLVKIDTQEGVRHGRWHCLDFSDSVLQSRTIDEPRFVDSSQPVNHPDLSKDIYPNNYQATNICDTPISFLAGNPAIPGVISYVDDASGITKTSLVNHRGASMLVQRHSESMDPMVAMAMIPPSAVDVILEAGGLSNGPSNSELGSHFDFASRFQSFQLVAENLLSPRTRKRSETSESEFVDESGASAVAIDNKIEQAMDLVKSHLMFAVREEVEQLKLRIQELTDRNNQLEYENTVLRASAPQETLAKLQKLPAVLPS